MDWRNADLAKHKVIILGDDLFSREPFCQLILSKGFHFVLVCKPDSHKTLYEYVDYLEKSTDIKTLSFKKWNGRFHELFNFRYCNNLPIKDGENVLQVNWVEITVTNLSTGAVSYKNSFITDFELNPDSVPLIVQAGRQDGKWKMKIITF